MSLSLGEKDGYWEESKKKYVPAGLPPSCATWVTAKPLLERRLRLSLSSSKLRCTTSRSVDPRRLHIWSVFSRALLSDCGGGSGGPGGTQLLEALLHREGRMPTRCSLPFVLGGVREVQEELLPALGVFGR